MPLLSPADQEKLKTDFASMTRPVRLLFFTQTLGCETCLQTRQVLDELPVLSDQISIEEFNVILDKDKAAEYDVDRAPSIVVAGVDQVGGAEDSRIRFLGAPAGYEFISLIRAVLLVGGAPSMLSEAGRERLAAIDRPTTLKVFTTPTCPHCPKAVTLAHEIAFASPLVTAFAVEATEFPDLARQYSVTGVPKTVVNEVSEILGAVPEDTFIEQVVGSLKSTAEGQQSGAEQDEA